MEERCREMAQKFGFALAVRPRMCAEIPGLLGWLFRIGELPVLDARYACGLDDIERLLSADLPGFGLVELYEPAAKRTVALVGSRIAGAGGREVYELPDDRIAVVDHDLGLLAVHPDLKSFVAADYPVKLVADVVWTVTGASIAAT